MKKQNKKLILKSGLQSKYYLRLQSLSKQYPTQEDFIFECINHVVSTSKKLEDLENISFSKSSLKDVFGEKLQNPLFVKKIKDTIQLMIKDGTLLKPDDDTLSIPTDTISRLFRIG